MSRAHRTSFWSAAASEARRRFRIAYAPRSTPKRRRRCALPANSKTLSACSRFLKSCNLQHRTRIGAMNLPSEERIDARERFGLRRRFLRKRRFLPG